MTSVLPDEDGKAVKLKQKMEGQQAKEESRSFLTFSRENLSISHSDLEQGFNKHRFRPSRNTILSTASLVIALLCLGLETWELRCSLVNGREIEGLKRDVDTLKHRFLEADLLDELKAFEEQLYAEDTNDETDTGEADIENADYDIFYQDDSSSSHDYSSDYHTPPTYGSRPSDFPEGTTSPEPVPTPSEPSSNKALVEFFAALRRVEAKRGQEFEKSVHENHKNIERERLLEEHKKKDDREEKIDEKDNSTRHRRDIPNESAWLRNVLLTLKRSVGEDGAIARSESVSGEESLALNAKTKRSIPDDEEIEGTEDVSRGRTQNRGTNQRNVRNQTRRVVGPRSRAREEVESLEETEKGEKCPPVHPPKKYGDRTSPCPPVNTIDATDRTQNEKPIRQVVRATRHSTEGTENGRGLRYSWRDVQDSLVEDGVASRKLVQDSERMEIRPRRVMRRNLQPPPQVCAVHYGADSSLFTTDDEHTGNGRARHSDGIFKAWKSSNWVSDLGMAHFFTLANDGKLTVHQSGLYLLYAQIHYLDEHDENGFHVLVNGRPILQCMVYSPGMGHKSRSCFSAQATFLHAGDKLVLKDIGSARYTLFQHDKSFFGLVKVGEVRQQPRRLSASRQ